jgi:ribokinase
MDERAGPRIVVVGSLNLDLTLRVPRLPGPGETVLSSGPAQSGFGGKGANQAAAAAAFGATVAMIGRIGDDEAGQQILADLRGRGIEVSPVLATPGARTGGATIAVNPAGENIILVDPGANSDLRPADVRPDLLAAADAVLVQLEIPVPVVAAVVTAAAGRAVLNPAPARSLPADILRGAGVLVPNLTELALLTGRPQPADLASAVRLARELPGDADVVVTLGSRGALVVPGSGRPGTHIGAPACDVVDATGAGDCFCGSLAVSLAEGMDLTDAVRLSVAAASLSVTAPGARGYAPGRAEAAALAGGLRVQSVPD